MSNPQIITNDMFEQAKQARINECVVRQDVQVFRAVINAYVLPLFHSASIEGPVEKGGKAESCIGKARAKSVDLHVPGRPAFFYTLKRRVAFTAQEQSLLRDIMEQMHGAVFKAGSWNHVSLCSAIERAIARELSPEHADTILQVLQVYAQWAAETYEGRRISHTTGICPKSIAPARRNFYELRNSTVFKVLGTAPDTILTLDKDGSVIGIETVSAKQNNYRKNKDVLAPIDMADLALWTNATGKIAFRLRPNGEILIFRDRQLVYAKRRSYWRSFPSKSIIYEHFSVPYSTGEENSKRAMYLTALDLAFSGKGGCLGMLQTENPIADANMVVNENMLFSSSSPASSVQLLSAIVDSAKFQEIPRRVRLGFCSLDGATLIDSQGTLLTAGAILRTNGNPFQGGGRTAAAQALGGYGLGVKISDDGFVEIHQGGLQPLLFA